MYRSARRVETDGRLFAVVVVGTLGEGWRAESFASAKQQRDRGWWADSVKDGGAKGGTALRETRG